MPIGAKAIRVLDRYLRARASHPWADEPWLWLSQKGRLTDSGIRQLLERRGIEAGIGPVNPHRFRHTFSHRWLVGGGNEGDLMRLTGPTMRTRVVCAIRRDAIAWVEDDVYVAQDVDEWEIGKLRRLRTGPLRVRGPRLRVDAATPGLDEVERLRRAEHLLRAHMKRLALRSSRARRKVAS